MIRQLNDDRRNAASGQTRSLVIFLHGYGADGADLLGLADVLGEHLPDTAFRAPDAPEPCRNNPFGKQWFPVPWLDGSSEAAAAESMAQSARDLDAYLDLVLEEESLTPYRVCLFGFSQGTMMALQVGLRRREPFAGIVAFSGRLLSPEVLEAEITARPPVLLLHGDADPVVPFEDMDRAARALVKAQVETYGHVMKGTGHGIAPDGLSAALGFLHQRLYGK
jgi:phospholipase/carboxylesterase